MGDLSASISGLRIDGQAVAFTVTLDGPDHETCLGHGEVVVYDASGTERWRQSLGELTVPQRWDAHIDLPAGDLGDGEFAAWVNAQVWIERPVDEDGSNYREEDERLAQEGVNFLVGRGRVYASAEEVAARGGGATVRVENLRLSGDWAVFDLINRERFDVPVAHQLVLYAHDGSERRLQGEELVQAGATQQAHHLLPDDLIDGTYSLLAVAQVEGVDAETFADARIEVHDGTITVVP